MSLSNNVVEHKKANGQEFLQFRRLLQYSNIIKHAYSVGLNKNYRTFKANKQPLLNYDYKQNINDYKTLCEENNLNYENIIKANQAHTDTILKIEEIKKDKKTDLIDTKKESDGLMTNKKNIVLATTNADCILLLFFDPKKKVIANTHSGWKGTLQEISVKTVNKMEKEYGCNPRDIIVCICPSIRKCHFETDEDVHQLFYNQFEKLGNIEEFIEEKNGKWYIDTVLINKKILKKAGILDENIEDCGICSVCNKDLIHSYRAEGQGYGLSTAIIALK